MHAYWGVGVGGTGNDFQKIVAMTRLAREVKRNVKLSPIVITHKKEENYCVTMNVYMYVQQYIVHVIMHTQYAHVLAMRVLQLIQSRSSV